MIAHLLIAEGFASVRELAETPVEELTQIEAFDDDIAAALIDRANAWLDAQQEELNTKSAELGIQEDLLNFEGLEAETILKLGENEVKSRDDLADLATDELLEILGEGAMTEAEAEALIMKAREHWFAEADAQAAAEAEAAQNDNGEETAEETAEPEAASNA